MKYKEILHNNLKFLIAMLFVIVLGVVGVAYALDLIGEPTNINVSTATLTAVIGGDTTVTSTGTMLPIEDGIIDTNGVNTTDNRVLKATFTVSNVDANPANTIYDIALHDIVMDCNLKSKYLKWRLYKDGTKISEGSFSPTFDINIVDNDRLVLTTTQQDLSSTNTYVFLMWISESCPSDIDIAECTGEMDQSNLLNKNFSATIKIELSTKTKKELVRIKGTELVC